MVDRLLWYAKRNKEVEAIAFVKFFEDTNLIRVHSLSILWNKMVRKMELDRVMQTN